MDQEITLSLLDQLYSNLVELVGEDWLQQGISEHAKYWSDLAGRPDQLFSVRRAHPIIELVSRFPDWRKALQEQKQIVSHTVFEFARLVLVLQNARQLPGGPEFISDLLHNNVYRRARPKAFRQFWDSIFEAEVAWSMSASGNRLGFGPPNKNPDLFMTLQPDSIVPEFNVPIECWRLGKTSARETEVDNLIYEFQKTILKQLHGEQLPLKVAIRAHRKPVRSDFEGLYREVGRLGRSLSDSEKANGIWKTSGVLNNCYQVSVGHIDSIEVPSDQLGLNIGLFDTSSERTVMYSADFKLSENRAHAVLKPIVIAFRTNDDPLWFFDHVKDAFERKSKQLAERSKPTFIDRRTGQAWPCGVIALKIPKLTDPDLLALDELIRNRLRHSHKHVSAVIFFWGEAIHHQKPMTSPGQIEITAGSLLNLYTIPNPDAFLPLFTSHDSRVQKFGSTPGFRINVDMADGHLSREHASSFDIEDASETATWPPLPDNTFESLTSRVGSLVLRADNPDFLWTTPGDILLQQIQFGDNQLRIIRDRHLNIRAIRVGGYRLRDHVALDLRPFRGAKMIIILVRWDQESWRLCVGTNGEAQQLCAKALR